MNEGFGTDGEPLEDSSERCSLGPQAATDPEAKRPDAGQDRVAKARRCRTRAHHRAAIAATFDENGRLRKPQNGRFPDCNVLARRHAQAVDRCWLRRYVPARGRTPPAVRPVTLGVRRQCWPSLSGPALDACVRSRTLADVVFEVLAEVT